MATVTEVPDYGEDINTTDPTNINSSNIVDTNEEIITETLAQQLDVNPEPEQSDVTPEPEVKEKPIETIPDVVSSSEDQIECIQTSFTNVNGLKINARIWRPPTEPYRGMICILHGYGAHCMRFDTIARNLALRGVVAFGHDYVGMGESEGVREPATDFTLYTQDIIQHINIMKDKYKDLPLFMLGQSIGSLLILLCLLDLPELANGIILMGTAVKPAVGYISRMGLWCINSIAPKYALRSSDSSGLSRDEEQIRIYENDPLAWKNGFTVGFVHTFFSHLDLVRPRLSEIQTPVLIYHGGADKVVTPDNAQLIYSTVQSTDKEIRIWQGCLHSLIHESLPDRQNVSNGIIKWILDRIK